MRAGVHRLRQESFGRIVVAWTLVMAGLMVGAFFGKMGADFSRVWIATWYAAAFFALFGERLVLSLLVNSWIREGRLNRRTVVVGGGHQAEELIKALEASNDTDIRIAGIFDDRGNDRVSPIVSGYPKLGNIDELIRFARNSRGMSRPLLNSAGRALPVDDVTRLAGPSQVSV